MGGKGAAAEEALKRYFTDLGYFVVRGMSVIVGDSDVTDIDLWLYNRPSPLTRERINVDVKNKRTPQALERIFWAKGVQTVLGFDACIVATSDRRPEVVEFGRAHGVTVLDGTLLRRICEKANDAMQESEFKASSAHYKQARAQIGWYERTVANASVLGRKLGFDACNHLLPEIRFFANEAQMGGSRGLEAVRYLYLTVSYFLVSLDFSLSDAAFLGAVERQQRIDEGLRFGQSGKAGTERIAEVAVRLAAASTGANPGAIRSAVRQAWEEYPVAILAEYFGRTAIYNSLFGLAREFNRLGYERNLTLPKDLRNGARSTLFVLLDFLDIDRQGFIASTTQGPVAEAAGESSIASVKQHPEEKPASGQQELGISSER